MMKQMKVFKESKKNKVNKIFPINLKKYSQSPVKFIVPILINAYLKKFISIHTSFYEDYIL